MGVVADLLEWQCASNDEELVRSYHVGTWVERAGALGIADGSHLRNLGLLPLSLKRVLHPGLALSCRDNRMEQVAFPTPLSPTSLDPAKIHLSEVPVEEHHVASAQDL